MSDTSDSDDRAAVATLEPAEAAAPATAHPCPRCGKDKGAETRMLCPACWVEVPSQKRRRWCLAFMHYQTQHPAARAILSWATPDRPPAPRPRPGPAPAAWRCARCHKPGKKMSRGALARLLREILAEGLPRQVRERAELVARLLDGLCQGCATQGDG